MAFDESIAARVRQQLKDRDDVRERKMFGGIAFMVRGNMAVGVGGDAGDDLMVRVGKARWTEFLFEEHARDTSGNFRPMRGFIWVQPAGYATDEQLSVWVQRGVDYAQSLPPK